jgi:ketosteroid isomerase-like protein
MLDSDLAAFIERDRQALDAIVKGDPEPKKRLYSRRDDVTLANPFGVPARGWQKVAETLERAASQLREGKVLAFERISEYATAELAYIVEIERYHGKAGSSEAAPNALRVTTVFRREDGEWRIVHRHADPITGPRPPESILQK